MSNFNIDDCDPWTDRAGIYAIFNVDGQNAVDLDNAKSGDRDSLHAWDFGDSLDVTNPNQLWQFASVGDQKWLIINQKSGKYIAAPDHDTRAIAQTGSPDDRAAHWRIVNVDLPDKNQIAFMSVKNKGDCLEVKNGGHANGTELRCVTLNKARKGQIFCVKRRN